MDEPNIAVVIATCRRPDLLHRCLEALCLQTLPASDFEVIVVDDGHTADTRAVVERFSQLSDMPRFRYLESQGTRGPAGARNVGWRATRAALIAFTDDDTIPASDWLEQGCKAISVNWAAAGGRVVVPPPRQAPTDHARNTQGLERAEFATANAFVWRHALMSVDGFDERFTRAWREDSDLQFSLMRDCGPVGWAPSAVVAHPVREVPWGFSLKTQANVFFDALLFKKHPTLYRQRIRPRPPWRYYFIVLCTLVALLAALAGEAWLALGLCLPALVAVGIFAAERLHGTAHTPSHIAEMLLTSLAIPYLSVYWRVKGAWHFRVPFV
jgi:hypothetical protein